MKPRNFWATAALWIGIIAIILLSPFLMCLGTFLVSGGSAAYSARRDALGSIVSFVVNDLGPYIVIPLLLFAVIVGLVSGFTRQASQRTFQFESGGNFLSSLEKALASRRYPYRRVEQETPEGIIFKSGRLMPYIVVKLETHAAKVTGPRDVVSGLEKELHKGQ